MILLLDNYDSFVYNLSRYIVELGFETCVIRNDRISLVEIEALDPTHIVLSPGPCTPNEAGICLDVIKHFASKIPMLGICLGHQAIAQAFGGEVVHATKPMHGMSSMIAHDGTSKLFAGLPQALDVARYHSLIVSPDAFPACLRVTAHSGEREIMALEHVNLPLYGLQFHPESVLTQHGYSFMKNFLEIGL